jgi:hypothetical protein
MKAQKILVDGGFNIAGQRSVGARPDMGLVYVEGNEHGKLVTLPDVAARTCTTN